MLLNELHTKKRIDKIVGMNILIVLTNATLPLHKADSNISTTIENEEELY